MIDWLSFVAPCAHSVPVTGGSVLSLGPDGDVEWQAVKRSSVRGSHDATLQIRTAMRGADRCSHVEISGNPVKWFQGHNLWGTDDLPGLLVATLEALCAHDGLPLCPTVEDRAAWHAGDVALSRVDVTESFHLRHRAEVLAFLRAMEQSAHLAHRGRGQLVKGSTLYYGRHSRRWSLKLYAKGQEIEAKGHGQPALVAPVARPADEEWIDGNLSERACKYHGKAAQVLLPAAQEWADRTLRAELTLRSMELKRLGLDRVSTWLPIDGVPFAVTSRLLRDRMGGLTMTTASELDAAVLEAMRPALRTAYEAWAAGADLRGILSRRSFYRYRAQLLVHGIDIATVQSREASNVVPLIRILEAVPVGVPEWAVGTPLYFEPRRVA